MTVPLILCAVVLLVAWAILDFDYWTVRCGWPIARWLWKRHVRNLPETLHREGVMH